MATGDSKAERKALSLRLNPDVLAEIQRLAAAELRSVNSQIEVLLREALQRRKSLSPSPYPPNLSPETLREIHRLLSQQQQQTDESP